MSCCSYAAPVTLSTKLLSVPSSRLSACWSCRTCCVVWYLWGEGHIIWHCKACNGRVAGHVVKQLTPQGVVAWGQRQHTGVGVRGITKCYNIGMPPAMTAGTEAAVAVKSERSGRKSGCGVSVQVQHMKEEKIQEGRTEDRRGRSPVSKEGVVVPGDMQAMVQSVSAAGRLTWHVCMGHHHQQRPLAPLFMGDANHSSFHDLQPPAS